MKLINLKDDQQQVSFTEAVKTGLGRNQGVFFPTDLCKLENVEALLALPFKARSAKILSHLIGDELPSDTVEGMVEHARAGWSSTGTCTAVTPPATPPQAFGFE